jgi:hypothetical protein
LALRDRPRDIFVVQILQRFTKLDGTLWADGV